MPKRKGKTPKHYVSHTQLTTYRRCPRYYKAVYIDGISSHAEYHLKYGSVMHMAARIINNMAKEERQLSPEDAAGAFREAEKERPMDEYSPTEAIHVWSLPAVSEYSPSFAREAASFVMMLTTPWNAFDP